MTEKSYNWQLVEFSENLTTEGVPYVDCVPATWIIYSPVTKILLSYYPAPPYNKEVLHDLLKKVKNKESPAKEWPLWSVNIRGGADTYKKAVKRLVELKTKLFAFTSDAEISAEKQREYQIQRYKKRTLQEIMDVPKIIDKSDNNNNNNFSNDTPSTSSVESLSKTHNQKKKLKKSKQTDKQKVNVKENMLEVIKERKISDFSLNDKEDNRENTDEMSLGNFEKEDSSTIIDQSILNTSNNFENYSADHNEFENELTDITKNGIKLLLRAILVNRQIMLKTKKEIEDLRCDVRQIQNNNSLHIFDPVNDFDIEMPIKSMKDFLNFDLTLNNEDTAKKFVGFTNNCLDRSTNNPTKSVHAILRKIFTRDLALQFTAIRKSGDRTIFKTTNTYKNMKDVLMSIHTTTEGTLISEKIFHTALGAGFANARDWDGHRSRPWTD